MERKTQQPRPLLAIFFLRWEAGKSQTNSTAPSGETRPPSAGRPPASCPRSAGQGPGPQGFLGCFGSGLGLGFAGGDGASGAGAGRVLSWWSWYHHKSAAPTSRASNNRWFMVVPLPTSVKGPKGPKRPKGPKGLSRRPFAAGFTLSETEPAG